MRVGVDEAGKGPVLGPMVVAAVRAPPEAVPDGVDDSKRLSATRREELAATLRSASGVESVVVAVTTDRIDDPGTDMNGLTVAGQAEAVAGVARDGDDVIADAGDVDEARFGRRLREGVADAGTTVAVTARHGADADDAHVAAASVLAKVERDRRVDALDAAHGECGPVGSGYPSDPTTREFLRTFVERNGRLPDCARRSWQTCADLVELAEQASLSEF